MNTSKFPLLRFIWRQSKAQVITVGMLFAIAMMIVFKQPLASVAWKATYSDFLSPIIAFGTLLVAIGVWYNEQRENWQEQMEKRLNIIYLLEREGKWTPHGTILNAPLTGEGDIRSWGQSIAQTILPQEQNGGTAARINFTGFKMVNTRVERRSQYRYYGLLIFLSTPITGAEDGKVYIFDHSGAKWEKHDKIPDGDAFDALQHAIPSQVIELQN